MPPKFIPLTTEHIANGILVMPPGLKTSSGYTKGYLNYNDEAIYTVIVRDGKPLKAVEPETIKPIAKYASIPQIMNEKGFVGMRFETDRLQKQRAYATFEGRVRDRVGYLYSKNGESWWSFPGKAGGEEPADTSTGFTPEQIASMLARIDQNSDKSEFSSTSSSE